jgi:hypothetical protein
LPNKQTKEVAVGFIVPQGAGTGSGRAQLVAFREGWYSCLERRSDALFELTDALLCADGPVNSLPHLSLEPEFRRGWGSGYAALAKGGVDMEAMRDLLVARRDPDWPLVFAVDASTMERCDAETSPERGFYYHASKHSAGQPIVAGWSYQWITQLNWAKDSWTVLSATCFVHAAPLKMNISSACTTSITLSWTSS